MTYVILFLQVKMLEKTWPGILECYIPVTLAELSNGLWWLAVISASRKYTPLSPDTNKNMPRISSSHSHIYFPYFQRPDCPIIPGRCLWLLSLQHSFAVLRNVRSFPQAAPWAVETLLRCGYKCWDCTVPKLQTSCAAVTNSCDT